jgi:pimeloyl-ACP methyl ester carboxylesterase
MKEKGVSKIRKYLFNRIFMSGIILLIIFPAIAVAADPPGIPDGWSHRFAYVNGVRISYYHAVPAPGKPVIVMVHGVTDNGLKWATLTWKLQKDYDIYMLDTRGHGLSDPFTHSDDGQTLIKDVVDFVRVMNFEKPILIGHSMGAATVMRLGAEYPDVARAIIMLDPGIPRRVTGESPPAARPATTPAAPPATPQATPPATPRATPPAAPPRAPQNAAPDRITLSMRGDPESLVRQNNYSFEDLVEKGKRDNPKWDIVDIKYWALSKIQYHGPYSEQAWLAMNGTMRTENSLSNIKVPSLILKADTSPEGRKTNEEAVKGMQKVKLVHVDGAGHNLQHDDLNRTVKEISTFLRDAL